MNEDKIKVLKKALIYLKIEGSLSFGICDAINCAVSDLDFAPVFSQVKFYGIQLPKRTYFGSMGYGTRLFSYPCTKEGKQQRIEVIKEAIKRLQS